MYQFKTVSRGVRLAFVAGATLAAFSANTPSGFAAPANPNIPKGTFKGTFVSDDSTLTGPIRLVITSARQPNRQVETLMVRGKLTIGTKVKNKPFLGTYTPSARFLAGATVVRRGYAGAYQGTLSLDGKTLTGTWGYNRIPQDDDQQQGTATISKP